MQTGGAIGGSGAGGLVGMANALGGGSGGDEGQTAAFNALVSRRSLRNYLEEAYADNTLVTDDLVDVAYEAAHQRGARHAPAAFIAGHLNIDVRRALRRC